MYSVMNITINNEVLLDRIRSLSSFEYSQISYGVIILRTKIHPVDINTECIYSIYVIPINLSVHNSTGKTYVNSSKYLSDCSCFPMMMI